MNTPTNNAVVTITDMQDTMQVSFDSDGKPVTLSIDDFTPMTAEQLNDSQKGANEGIANIVESLVFDELNSTVFDAIQLDLAFAKSAKVGDKAPNHLGALLPDLHDTPRNILKRVVRDYDALEVQSAWASHFATLTRVRKGGISLSSLEKGFRITHPADFTTRASTTPEVPMSDSDSLDALEAKAAEINQSLADTEQELKDNPDDTEAELNVMQLKLNARKAEIAVSEARAPQVNDGVIDAMRIENKRLIDVNNRLTARLLHYRTGVQNAQKGLMLLASYKKSATTKAGKYLADLANEAKRG